MVERDPQAVSRSREDTTRSSSKHLQNALGEAIQTVRSAVILIGQDGLRSCFRARGKKPKVPALLRRLTWVDLRGGMTESGLDHLEWGITGIKPKRRRDPTGSRSPEPHSWKSALAVG